MTEKGKQQHDKGLLSARLHPGDHVLVKNLLEKGGPGKLRSFWEQDIYVVVKQVNEETPVYEVRKRSGQGGIEATSQEPPETVQLSTNRVHG